MNHAYVPEGKCKYPWSKLENHVSLLCFLVWLLFSCSYVFIFILSYTCTICCVAATDIINVDSLQYDFSTIEVATNKFSEDNKLGEGGFGVVYKVLKFVCLLGS